LKSRADSFGQIVCEIEQSVGVTRRVQGAPTGKVFAAQTYARIALPFLGGFVVDPALKGRDRCFSGAQGPLSRDPNGTRRLCAFWPRSATMPPLARFL
jgi:hypothetical protein